MWLIIFKNGVSYIWWILKLYIYWNNDIGWLEPLIAFNFRKFWKWIILILNVLLVHVFSTQWLHCSCGVDTYITHILLLFSISSPPFCITQSLLSFQKDLAPFSCYPHFTFSWFVFWFYHIRDIMWHENLYCMIYLA